MKNKNTIHKKNTIKKKKIKKIKTKKNMKGGSMMAGAGLLFALGLISGAFSGSMNQVKKPTILNHINNEKLQDIMKRPIGDLDKVSLETFVNAGLDNFNNVQHNLNNEFDPSLPMAQPIVGAEGQNPVPGAPHALPV